MGEQAESEEIKADDLPNQIKDVAPHGDFDLQRLP